MRQSRVQLGKGMGVHQLDHGASGQSNVDDIVRRIRRVPGDLSSSGFPDGEVFATGHDGSDFMLPNAIAMPMVLKWMLGNEIPEFLQIFSRDVLRLAGEVDRFI